MKGNSFNAEVLVREINLMIQQTVEMAYEHKMLKQNNSSIELLENSDGMMRLGIRLCIFYGIDQDLILDPRDIMDKLESKGGKNA